jgi:pimeloyl-ACP methyl ester carboxylesterase
MRTVVVVHGANGAASEVWPLAAALRPAGHVVVPDLLGHGGRPVQRPLRFDALVDDLVASVDPRFGPVWWVGYSLGATLALAVALRHPERTLGVVALAPKVVLDAETVEKWTYLADPERLGRPDNPRQFELANAHHPEDWREVARSNQAMFRDLMADPPVTEAALRAIRVPTLVVYGTNDPIVPLREAEALAEWMRSSNAALPGPAHPLSAIPLAAVAKTARDWMVHVEGLRAART